MSINDDRTPTRSEQAEYADEPAGAGVPVDQAQVIAERRAYMRPLFDYCEAHGMICLRLMRGPWQREVGWPLRRQQVWRLKTGYSPAPPPWFIAEVCREIGQPVEVVMGAEWAQRHLSAPTPELPATTQQDDAQDDAQDVQRRAS